MRTFNVKVELLPILVTLFQKRRNIIGTSAVSGRFLTGSQLFETALPGKIRLSALVDTAATFSKIPSSTLNKLGIKEDFKTKLELGDGRKIKRKVGYVKIKLNKKCATVPVVFGKKGELPLIGATTLEIMGLIPDPTRKVLLETYHLEAQLKA